MKRCHRPEGLGSFRDDHRRFALLIWTGPAGFDGGGDAAAGAEFAADDGPDGIAGFHHVFEDLVDDVFLEDAEVAVAEEIFLKRFEFEAAGAGHVANGEVAEVGQAGLGADGGEFGIVDDDFVVGELILPGLDFGEFEVEAGLGVIVGVARLWRHISIVRGTKMNMDSCKFLLLKGLGTSLIYWLWSCAWLRNESN